MSGRRGVAAAALAALLLVGVGAALTLALLAAPARAYDGWQHDGASSCADCHNGQPLDDSTCTKFCHVGFKSLPDKQCWSCHYPGEDTSSLSSPSLACSQTCHLWDQSHAGYVVAFTHGTTPHLGASGYGKTCLDCHQTSTSFNVPDGSPHHSGQTTPPPTCQDCHNGEDASAVQTHDGQQCTACHSGMDLPAVPQTCNQCHPASTFGTPDCLKCHADQVHTTTPQPPACADCHGEGYQQHAGRVACLTCHTGIAGLHHGTSKTATQKTCRACHPQRHAGVKVPNNKCATCHKGTGAGPAAKAQHSTAVTKSSVCSGCHAKQLHATALGSGITSCGACHTGLYHAAQPTPPNSVCLACHASAAYHTNGFACALCHRNQIHKTRPLLPKIRG